MTETFKVDLRGLVDLLSQHLYATPRVYIRELLQNAVDAISAAHGAGNGCGRILIEALEDTGQGTLRVSDNGIGLSESQCHEFLATIGRSSKRDELGFARSDFLGQFGIGLLSCFMVADEIVVATRHGEGQTVVWTGRSDGGYSVRPARPEEQRPEPGTTVTLVPRPGCEHWLARDAVVEMARHYGAYLPIQISVGDTPVTGASSPWERRTNELSQARHARLTELCLEQFGFLPFDIIDIDVAEAGLRGVAFVLPMPANPSAAGGHQVYLKQMLLSTAVEGLVPEWAFFARCVVDTTQLRPTASREALYDDDLLEAARAAIGVQLRGWLVGMAANNPRSLTRFLQIHHLGVKALALHDDEMLRLLAECWPLQTNVGPLTAAEFADRYGLLRYCPSLDEFRQIAPVAAAQGLALANAGFVYDTELLRRMGDALPGMRTEELSAADLTTHLERLAPDLEHSLRPFLSRADECLRPLGCQIRVRSFDPVSLPALYLLDQDTAFQQDLSQTMDSTDETWTAILGQFQVPAPEPPQLVLNHRNALVRQVVGLEDQELTRMCVEGMYAQALLQGHHPLRAADTAALNQSFLGLITRAVANGAQQ